jgi:hypothetical protein
MTFGYCACTCGSGVGRSSLDVLPMAVAVREGMRLPGGPWGEAPGAGAVVEDAGSPGSGGEAVAAGRAFDAAVGLTAGGNWEAGGD